MIFRITYISLKSKRAAEFLVGFEIVGRLIQKNVIMVNDKIVVNSGNDLHLVAAVTWWYS